MTEPYFLDANCNETSDDLDLEECRLILDHNAYPLILIEKATDIYRCAFQNLDKDYFYTLLYELMPRRVGVLPTETFSFDYSGRRILHRHKDAIQLLKNEIERLERSRKSTIVGTFGIDLDEAGGHYSAYIYNVETQKVFMFDPMGNSAYINNFKQLARKIFGRVEIDIRECQSDLIFQPTGGFTGNDPSDLQRLPAWDLFSENQKWEYINQHAESQDHFCYMWSIWFIDAYVNHRVRKINQIRKKIIDSDRNLMPVMYIKAYILYVLHKTDTGRMIIDDMIKKYNYDFFQNFFTKVWHNPNLEDPLDFRPHHIDISRMKN